MYQPHARIGRILARGGYASGPTRHPSPFYMLYDRNDRYCGWCKEATIDDMTRAGILRPRPQGSGMVLWQDVTDDFRAIFGRMVEDLR
ncbi:hypothetical protein [uncultured Reyranella sp.]|jgi:hypothetical protein|uniref:hypothetical protein n=1 Tax=uncultured Reyranella sp. TaxID=735512 RepID=UPI00259D0A8A|nr:hypothetical protein [uncultured Reyranella sp.]